MNQKRLDELAEELSSYLDDFAEEHDVEVITEEQQQGLDDQPVSLLYIIAKNGDEWIDSIVGEYG
jgi:hypothetical protein